MYKIIELNNQQYLVKPGDAIQVPGVLGKPGDAVKNVKVLLSRGDKKTDIGEPYLKETISLTISDLKKSQKIRVATYRSKSRYRRVKGHRQDVTVLTYPSPTSKKSPAAKKTAAPSKKAPKKAAKKSSK